MKKLLIFFLFSSINIYTSTCIKDTIVIFKRFNNSPIDSTFINNTNIILKYDEEDNLIIHFNGNKVFIADKIKRDNILKIMSSKNHGKRYFTRDNPILNITTKTKSYIFYFSFKTNSVVINEKNIDSIIFPLDNYAINNYGKLEKRNKIFGQIFVTKMSIVSNIFNTNRFIEKGLKLRSSFELPIDFNIKATELIFNIVIDQTGRFEYSMPSLLYITNNKLGIIPFSNNLLPSFQKVTTDSISFSSKPIKMVTSHYINNQKRELGSRKLVFIMLENGEIKAIELSHQFLLKTKIFVDKFRSAKDIEVLEYYKGIKNVLKVKLKINGNGIFYTRYFEINNNLKIIY